MGVLPGRDPSRSRPPRSAPRRGPAGARRAGQPPRAAGWDHVASWYDRLVGDEGSDYHQQVIIPAALRLLAPRPGERFLDVCCGQGVFCRALLQQGAGFVHGVDASALLIEAAQRRGGGVEYTVADARRLGPLADGSYDGASCLMALQDLDDMGSVCSGMAAALRPGGRAVLILMHPCFRIPRQSSWGWDEAHKTQYRRIDRYATPQQIPISTRPGAAPDLHTTFHHRPLRDYVNALGEAGLPTIAADELLSHRRSSSGGKARGENRAAAEIPVFLALLCRRL